MIQIEESPSSHLRVFFEYFSSFLSVFSFKLCVPRMGEGDPAGILPAFFLLSSLFLSVHLFALFDPLVSTHDVSPAGHTGFFLRAWEYVIKRKKRITLF